MLKSLGKTPLVCFKCKMVKLMLVFVYDTLSAIVYMKCPFEVNFQVPYFILKNYFFQLIWHYIYIIKQIHAKNFTYIIIIMRYQGNPKKDIPMDLSKYTILALNPNILYIFRISGINGIYPNLLNPNPA